MKTIEVHGNRVRKYCGSEEIFKAVKVHTTYLTDIFIPVVGYFINSYYEMPLGKPAEYTDDKLIPWIKSTYHKLKELGISHNDIMLQNIVVLPGNDYRLIDFETVRFDGGGSFHDWAKCNQLISRILLNCPNSIYANKDSNQSNVSFFRQ